MSAIAMISNKDIELGNKQPLSFQEEVDAISHKIDIASRESFAKIALLTIKYWQQEFNEQSYSFSAAKISLSMTFPFLLAIGFITAYASLVLFADIDYSNVVSLDFSNLITNTGALNAFITDIPAITLIFYLVLVRNAQLKATCDLLEKSYHAYLSSHDLSSDMREELYKLHLFKGKDFYLNPDLQSKTGVLHKSLESTLKEIDLEMKKGISIKELWKSMQEHYKNDSRTKIVAKVTAVTIPTLAIQTLSIFLLFQNLILLFGSPVKDLFLGDKTEALNEAFYLTQLGGFFSSITAFGGVSYFFYRSLIRIPYINALHSKINTCFERFSHLEATMKEALYPVKKLKLIEADNRL